MLPHSSALFPKLPGDILYLVAYFSSFETRASLVRCNRWLHEACTPLLFRDIYLHAPVQLVRLCINEGAMRMLSRTDSIYLGERLFSAISWSDELTGIVPDLIIRVLKATNSLTRLQIYSSDDVLDPKASYNFHDILGQRLQSAASDPAFLPNLTIIVELPDLVSLKALCHNRPIIYHYVHSSELYMDAEICPGSKQGGFGPNLKHNLTAQDVGILIRESRWTSPNVEWCLESGIHVRMRFPEEIKHGGQSVIQDPLTWTKAMLLASKIPFDELRSLDVTFGPNPPHQSIASQYAAVEELYKKYPKLEDAIFSYPNFMWSRGSNYRPPDSGTKFFPKDPLPVWTPFPSKELIPYWMDWWLDALGLNSQGAKGPAEITQTALMLMDGIRFRWDDDEWSVPDHEDLVQYLGFLACTVSLGHNY